MALCDLIRRALVLRAVIVVRLLVVIDADLRAGHQLREAIQALIRVLVERDEIAHRDARLVRDLRQRLLVLGRVEEGSVVVNHQTVTKPRVPQPCGGHAGAGKVGIPLEIHRPRREGREGDRTDEPPVGIAHLVAP